MANGVAVPHRCASDGIHRRRNSVAGRILSPHRRYRPLAWGCTVSVAGRTDHKPRAARSAHIGWNSLRRCHRPAVRPHGYGRRNLPVPALAVPRLVGDKTSLRGGGRVHPMQLDCRAAGKHRHCESVTPESSYLCCGRPIRCRRRDYIWYQVPNFNDLEGARLGARHRRAKADRGLLRRLNLTPLPRGSAATNSRLPEFASILCPSRASPTRAGRSGNVNMARSSRMIRNR